MYFISSILSQAVRLAERLEHSGHGEPVPESGRQLRGRRSVQRGQQRVRGGRRNEHHHGDALRDHVGRVFAVRNERARAVRDRQHAPAADVPAELPGLPILEPGQPAAADQLGLERGRIRCENLDVPDLHRVRLLPELGLERPAVRTDVPRQVHSFINIHLTEFMGQIIHI